MELIQVQKTYAKIYEGMVLTLRDVKYTPKTFALIDELKELRDKCPEILGRQCDGGCLTRGDNEVFARIHKVVSEIMDLTNEDSSLVEVKKDGVNYCLEAIKLMGYDVSDTRL